VYLKEQASSSRENRGDYPPINDYGLIGDCRTAALVSREGSIDWLCLPHFSGPTVFAALLDSRRGGHFAVMPGAPLRSERCYAGATSILQTTFHCRDGSFRLTDCMPVHPGAEVSALQPQREVLRVIEVLEGEPEIVVEFVPKLDYARSPARLQRRGALGWRCQYGDELFLLRADVELAPSEAGDRLDGRVRLAAGSVRYLSFSYTKGDIAALPLLGEPARKRIADTRAWWEQWSSICRYEGPYRDAIVRSAITLKLLDYALSGAVLAAPTSSLPENIGGSRNWDYRFCWLRDAAFTFRSFMELGYADEAAAFIEWLLHSTRLTWPELQVMYAAHGEADITEFELDHLEGYRGSSPVRMGNGAQDQLQLDVYGEVVLAAYDFVRSGSRLDATEARMLRGLGHTVCRLWREPDEGIWEIRDEPRHYTYSKLMCWVALDRLLKLHEGGHVRVPVEKFSRERDAIAAEIEEKGFNRQLNSYVGYYGGDQGDAALLLMARRGYIDGRDPRMVGTYRFHQRELGSNALIYRYRIDFDPLPEGEGAFIACSFWAVDCLVEQGRLEEARERFEALLEVCNDLGLLAEEVDAQTGVFCGNFPQAYSHLALIDAALALERGRVGKEDT
jgi:GH15 family glucan-1,4-alpha-glucosidase